MITASVATTKNQLSRLLRRVKLGESILITDRNRPVARLDVEQFLAAPRPVLRAGTSLARAVIEDREEA